MDSGSIILEKEVEEGRVKNARIVETRCGIVFGDRWKKEGARNVKEPGTMRSISWKGVTEESECVDEIYVVR